MFKKLLHPAILLMNHLPFKVKIVISMAILFLLLIIPAQTTFKSYTSKIKTFEDQHIGLHYTINMQDLIYKTQLHRGYSNAYLNGNKNFEKNIIESEKEMDRALKELLAFDKKSFDILYHDRNFVEALSLIQLVKFNKNLHKTDIDTLFKLHNQIINKLVKSLQKVSQRSSFATSHDLALNLVAQLLEDKLLLLQENTGQLRGMVAGIFAKGKLTPAQKSDIFSRYTLVKALERNLINNDLLSNLDNYMSIHETTTLLVYKLDKMLSVINQNIILEENLSHDPKLFFKQATEAIDTQSKLYDILAQTYEDLVNQMQKSAYYTLIWLVIGFLSIVFTSVYLFMAFYHSVAKSLNKLKNASELIASGETKIELTADSKDEIGSAILSFNDMSQKLDKSITFLDGYKMAIDESSIVSKTTPKGIITYVNKKFCEISGYSEEELLGRPHNIVRHPDMPKETFKQMWQTIKQGKIWKGIVKNARVDGSFYIVNATIIPVLDSEQNIIEYIGIRHDITELERTKEELQKQKIDPATGLLTGIQLEKDLESATQPVLMYLNIDQFSDINEFYGTKIADNVLMTITSILKQMFSNNICKIYKYHNDEFFLLFDTEQLSLEKIDELMNRVLDHIEEHTKECDGESCVSVNMSGGIAHYAHQKRYEKLINFAIIARKTAKKENKKFLTYNDDMNKENDYKNNIEWINKIKSAIQHDKFVPFFQPIIDNQNSTITKYESLIRMIDENGKAISPFFFLDIAKKAKLYTKITKIVIDKTLAQLAKTPQFEFSINITVDDIKDVEIKNYIIEKVKACKASEKIIFEITESEQIEDYAEVNSFITELKKYNVRIAIDDFGSGYANFEHILSLNADFIKIDGSLIKDITSNKDAEIITEAIIAFSKKIGSKTVVEYVHSQEVQDKVLSLGADFSQGFHLGEPKPTLSSLNTLVKEEDSNRP